MQTDVNDFERVFGETKTQLNTLVSGRRIFNPEGNDDSGIIGTSERGGGDERRIGGDYF